MDRIIIAARCNRSRLAGQAGNIGEEKSANSLTGKRICRTVVGELAAIFSLPLQGNRDNLQHAPGWQDNSSLNCFQLESHNQNRWRKSASCDLA
jgi:hypothetical protein